MSDKTAEELQDELTEMTIIAGEWEKKWHDLKRELRDMTDQCFIAKQAEAKLEEMEKAHKAIKNSAMVNLSVATTRGKKIDHLNAIIAGCDSCAEKEEE